MTDLQIGLLVIGAAAVAGVLVYNRVQERATRRQAAAALAATVAERDALLVQRDIALGERNELRRQLDEMTGERNEFRRQLDAALMTQAQSIRRSTREPAPSPSRQRSLFMASLPRVERNSLAAPFAMPPSWFRP